MFKQILNIVLLSLALGMAVAQSSGPVLDKLAEGSASVTGKAAPGSAPIVIYDSSTQVKTKIGVANTTADDGSFSTTVRPVLIKGHQIIAVDNNGNTSATVTVVAAGQS